MPRFSGNVFLYVLPILLSVAIGVGVSLAVIDEVDRNAVLRVLAGGAAGLVVGVLLALSIGGYRYFTSLVIVTYRSFMRSLAKHAIRSSLRQAMTPMTCAGILDRNGTVHLKVRLVKSVKVDEGDPLYVHEAVNDATWGIVRVSDRVDDNYIVCEPIDRMNVDFWEHLEDRMKFDTSAPNVYLVKLLPTDFLRTTENFLNDWR